MRIDVTYAGEPPRVIETAGESLLSSAAVSSSLEWAGHPAPVCAVQMRVRTDLAMAGGGLRVEICAWSGAHAAGAEALSDFGQEREVPRLALHPYRVWEVLPAGELARAVDVQVDGRIHLQRVGGALLDLTAYELLEARTLSQAERSENSLCQRVLLLHERIRAARPGMSDGEIGDLYGLGAALYDFALSGSGCDGDGCGVTYDE